MIEALYLLGNGKSFRHRETTPLIREGEDFVQVVGKLVDLFDTRHVIGIRKDQKGVEVRLDGRTNIKRSEILELIPMQFIGANPQLLIDGQPGLRRSFLDTGLFHVEPGYLRLLQDYQKVLSQRNAALRSVGNDPRLWDQALISLATKIDFIRKRYVSRLIPVIERLLGDWCLDIGFNHAYVQGWNEKLDYEAALKKALPVDRKQRFTTVGPHRADLLIKAGDKKSGRVISRGQLKVLVVAMVVAQADICREEEKFIRVLLFDDFGAELDRENRERLLAEIPTYYPQVVSTMLEPENPGRGRPVTMFHVEHGELFPG